MIRLSYLKLKEINKKTANFILEDAKECLKFAKLFVKKIKKIK